ncbi:tyrosine-type recombinase/integrase [Leptobacterium flavescens]|uniref:Tyrosine recombinase XerC n=1 Tax=Leptobacterium flavescens TaxID=472055 RepID=A0A6P0UMS0_9FLAO|nr:tyrosine recombinase XerC [Leptobacterium flavescens]NER12313.1 tyrosine-type recombinase/integrase [Leptobacterium flavescens]
MPFKAFLDYLQLEKKYSPHTIVSYSADLNAFLDFCKEHYELSEIDMVNYSVIRSWIVSLVDQGISNRSVNRKIASLKAYYKFLLKTEQIHENPLLKHKALKVPKKVEVPFSEQEMEYMFVSVPFKDDFEGRRNKLIIELFYATGMRRSELINLKMQDVDFSSGTIKILGKRNKERIVPLLASVLDKIKEYLEYKEGVESSVSGDFLFLLKNGNKIYETLVYRVINTYFSMASSKAKKSPHILRHTFATHMLSQGADLNSVKELLGHASLASTQVYTHNSISELKKAYQNAHPRNKSNS